MKKFFRPGFRHIASMGRQMGWVLGIWDEPDKIGPGRVLDRSIRVMYRFPEQPVFFVFFTTGFKNKKPFRLEKTGFKTVC